MSIGPLVYGFGGEDSSVVHLVDDGDCLSEDPFHNGEQSSDDLLVDELGGDDLSASPLVHDGEYSSVNPLGHDGEYLFDDHSVDELCGLGEDSSVVHMVRDEDPLSEDPLIHDEEYFFVESLVTDHD